MKSLTDYINEKTLNEAIGQEKEWVYFCLGANRPMGLLGNKSWSPTTVAKAVDDKFIVVSASYDMFNNKAPIMGAWKEKYKDTVNYIEIMMCSYGDKNSGELIKTIGKAINGTDLTLVDVLKAFKAVNGRPIDIAKYTYNKLRQKINKKSASEESTEV